MRILRASVLLMLAGLVAGVPRAAHAASVHTTYLWHMHQPIYWPVTSTWNGAAYEHAYETITLGHSQSPVFSIFNSDDRVHDYQDYPRNALASVLDLPDAGAQVSFAGSLVQNVGSLAAAGWNGGRYAPNWWQPYRDAMGWSTSGGRRRLDPVIVAFHHSINPLVDPAVFRRMIQAQKAIMPAAWGSPNLSAGFFPAEMCFSERLIPILVEQGIDWTIVPDVHIARATVNYPYQANQDNCDPPNRADQLNPAQSNWQTLTISRGVTTKVPVPYGFRPHRARWVNPNTGAATSMIVVPAANGMSWNEGYGSYGTGEIDAVAALNDPARPMLVLFAHDGDNAWAGGHSYYNESVSNFSHAAAARGYEPTTVAEYLADHPVDAGDVVHVEDGGWVNADGDFGSPQFLNWNWPLLNASGGIDIPNGWAEDERNWAVLVAATNRVLTAEQMTGSVVDIARVVDPTGPATTPVEKAWHFLLAAHESGYMYYGKSLDFEMKPTLAANRAMAYVDPLLTGFDFTEATIWIPQRLPWNPGGKGGGALWGYPGGAGADMSRDFHVWTFVHDVSGITSAQLKYRLDADGVNAVTTDQNETYDGGPDVGAWQSIAMTRRIMPTGNVYNDPEITFTEAPAHIADQYWALVPGLSDKLVDYYVEVIDGRGLISRSPIQHVYVGTGDASPPGGAVTWEPLEPAAGGTLTIRYDAVAGALPDNTNPVRIHVGHSGWTNIVSPDPAMTFDAATQRWTYTYAIPATATAVDFVFNNGAGTWDNNGGADWQVPVSGAAPPPHVIDGNLDAGLVPVASCNGLDLYAEYDGAHLYLAAPAVGATSGLDHFLLVRRTDPGTTRPAPWAKTGTVGTLDAYLGNEDGNNWSGWFNAADQLMTGGFQHAAGAWLEASIDVAAAWGSAPASIRVAFAAWQTADGGTLAGQSPCGDGDGAVESGEWVLLEAPASGVPGRPDPGGGLVIDVAGANPVRGPLRATIESLVPGAGRLTVDLVDVRGRRVARLLDTEAARGVIDFDPAGAGVASGLYWLRAVGGDATAARKVPLDH
jgi:hypothetical protein